MKRCLASLCLHQMQITVIMRLGLTPATGGRKSRRRREGREGGGRNHTVWVVHSQPKCEMAQLLCKTVQQFLTVVGISSSHDSALALPGK